MATIREPARGTCPKCRHAMSDSSLQGYEVICPRCHHSWEPWRAAVRGDRSGWATAGILIGCGVCGIVIPVLLLALLMPILALPLGLMMLSDAPVMPGVFGWAMVLVVSAPMILSGIVAYTALERLQLKRTGSASRARAIGWSVALVCAEFAVMYAAPLVMR